MTVISSLKMQCPEYNVSYWDNHIVFCVRVKDNLMLDSLELWVFSFYPKEILKKYIREVNPCAWSVA